MNTSEQKGEHFRFPPAQAVSHHEVPDGDVGRHAPACPAESNGRAEAPSTALPLDFNAPAPDACSSSSTWSTSAREFVAFCGALGGVLVAWGIGSAPG